MKSGLLQLVIFYHVVDLMSFSNAAKRLNLSKAYVSKQIAHLEETMHATLLERNTRHLKLTFVGEQLFKHSRNIVLEYELAEQTIAKLQDAPIGILRVTAPPAYAAHILAGQLPRFLQAYPAISLHLKLTSDVLNLLENKIDVAIRLTHTPPADQVAKRIGHYQLQICASSEYLAKHTELKNPQQLTTHPCLTYASQDIEPWPFIINNKETWVYVTSRVVCNTYEILLAALLNHCGVARLPSYVIEAEVKKKTVQLIFQEHMPPPIPIYAVYAQSIPLSPIVRVFVQFLQTLEN